MFRALGTTVPSTNTNTNETTATPVRMEPPLSAALAAGVNVSDLPAVELSLSSSQIFSTSVGLSSKKTLASWHLTSPVEIVDSLLDLSNDPAKSNL